MLAEKVTGFPYVGAEGETAGCERSHGVMVVSSEPRSDPFWSGSRFATAVLRSGPLKTTNASARATVTTPNNRTAASRGTVKNSRHPWCVAHDAHGTPAVEPTRG
jgi:hypothetical protein